MQIMMRHQGCGGIIRVQRAGRGSARMMCGRCQRTTFIVGNATGARPEPTKPASVPFTPPAEWTATLPVTL